MAEALDLSAKQEYLLVALTWDGGSRYYTDWTSDVPFEGNTYVSTPDMEVKLPINDGLFAAQDCRIAVPMVDTVTDFTQRVTSGLPFPRVTATVAEILRTVDGGPQTNVNRLFVGELVVGRRNYNRNRKKIVLQFLPIKAQLETIALGLPCTHQCIHYLGSPGCGIDMTLSPRKVTVTITAIDGKEVTIASHPTVEAQADYFYHRGFLQKNSLNISIREWRSHTPLKFYTVRQAPDFWVGQTLTLLSGCDGSKKTCINRYNNEEHFLGLGYAMPAYHPNFEEGL